MKKIKQIKEDIADKRSAIDAIAKECEERTRTDEESEKWATLKGEINNLTAELIDLEDLEADKATRAGDKAEQERVAKAVAGEAASKEDKEVEKAKEVYSPGKALRALYKNQPLTGIEAEVQKEAEEELRSFGKSAAGVAIPASMLDREVRTDIDQATSGLAPTEVGAYTKALRENAIYSKVGVQVLNGLTADHKIPVVGKQNVAWAATENAAAADGGTNFTEKTLTPNRITAFVNVSNTLLIQNGQVALNSVMEDLGRASANLIDQSMWSATGVSNAPDDIPGISGVLTFAEEGSFVDAISVFKDFVKAEETLAAGEGIQGNIWYLASPHLLGQIKRSPQVVSVTPATPNLGYSTQVANGYPVCYSVANDGTTNVTGQALFGDFSKVKLGFFGGMDMVLDRTGDALLNDQTRIVLHQHLDYTLIQGEAMVKFTSILV